LAFKVVWNRQALDEIADFDKSVRERIYTRVTVNLAESPQSLGAPLSGNLAGLWRYRVGDYRVVFAVDLADRLIRILAVGHRKDVYDR
jgi:mRNA interferase RelE/StbE